MCCKHYHIIFSTIFLKLKCKIFAQKEVIHSLKKKKSHISHVTSYDLTHFKKLVRVGKTKSLSFCLRYDLLIVFWGQNHNTFIFIKMMPHDLLVQRARSTVEERVFCFSTKTYRWRKLKLLQKAIFHSLHQSTIHLRRYS